MPGFSLTDDEERELADQARRDLMGDGNDAIGGLFAREQDPPVIELGDVQARDLASTSGLTDDDRDIATQARNDLLGVRPGEAATVVRGAFAPTDVPAFEAPAAFGAPDTTLRQPMERASLTRTAATPQSAAERGIMPRATAIEAPTSRAADPWEGIAGLTDEEETAAAPIAAAARTSNYGLTFGDDDDEGPVAGTQQAASASPAPRTPFAPPEYAPPQQGGASEDMFGPTASESRRLTQARRRERNARIAQAVMAGLGGVMGMAGAVAGSPGLAGAGMAIGGASKGLNAAQGRSAEVQDDIDRRVGASQARQGYADQQAAGAAASQRQAQQDQRQATLDDANLGLTQARTDATRQEQEASELDRALASNDQSAARGAYRAMINGLNDNSGFVAEQRAFVNSPEFEGASSELLRENAGRVMLLANNRHSGLLTGGGGRGGGGTDVWVEDPTHPNGGRMEHRGGAGRRTPSTPDATPSGGPAAMRPLARPATPTAATPPAAGVALPSSDDNLALLARYRGINLNSESGRAWLSEARRVLDGGTAEAAGMRREILTATERQNDGTNLPLQIDRAEWQRINVAARPLARATAQMRRITGAVDSADPAQLRAALHGGAVMARAFGASDLRGRIAGYMNTYFHDMGGANITESERRRYEQFFQSDSMAIDPAEFQRVIRNAQRDNVEGLDAILGTVATHPTIFRTEFYNRVIHPPRRAR